MARAHTSKWGDPRERFWSLVVKGDGCWTWTGQRHGRGYGKFRAKIHGGSLAHRASWFFTHGAIPPGLVVMHTCDNRICVRPDHLQLGTQADNMADMGRKGRAVGPPRGSSPPPPKHSMPGETNPSAKLTADDARAIRASVGVTQRVLARRYGVGETTIARIQRGTRWATA